MRLLLLLAGSLAFAAIQTNRPQLTADRMGHDPDGVARGSGHVRVTMGALTFSADDGAVREDGSAVEMRGHVHITLPAREDHTVVRYGSGNLLTDQPIGLTADHALMQNGRLEVNGKIVVVPVDPELGKVQLRGDELAMDLLTGDATLKGNVNTNIPAPADPTVVPKFVFHPFPPEIIR